MRFFPRVSVCLIIITKSADRLCAVLLAQLYLVVVIFLGAVIGALDAGFAMVKPAVDTLQ